VTVHVVSTQPPVGDKVMETALFAWQPPDAEGIAMITWVRGAVITGDLARVTLTELAMLTGSKRVPVLADIRNLKSMTREARKHYGRVTDVVLAIALLVASPATQVIANFFLGLNRPDVPTEMFTDEAQARAWLRRQPS
jgi:hypothetical protein